jgi:plastocyanin
VLHGSITLMARAMAPALLLASILASRGGRGAPEGTVAATGDVRVSVTVLGSDHRAQPAAQAIVWIPDAAAKARAPLAAAPRIASKSKRFDPRITAVPAGTTVEFPNLDRIFHNVFSLSPGATFDLGLYRNGASRAMTFDTAGLVRVYCNIHPQMAAYLLVIDGTIWAQTGANGGAVLAHVPAGHVGVRAWDEKGGDYQGTVDVVAGKTVTLAIALDGSSFKDAPHTNKYGKKYPPPDDDANRY